MRRIVLYIYQKTDWPNFSWDNEKLISLLGEVRNLQGKLVGKMQSLSFELRDEAVLNTLTLDITKSTEIEGEKIDLEQVRSSLARRLGLDVSGLVPFDRGVDGVVEMMLDATQSFNMPLTKERLFNWHSALFPTGRSGMYQIIIGDWRDDSTGPMQVVSGPLGREKVHYQAPKASELEFQMSLFLEWFNSENNIDPVIKAGIAHLWFVTLHPFEDGNGRIARAITDMLLARSDGTPQRFYSMSAQISKERKQYYDILEKTQKSSLDITDWLFWFFNCLQNSLDSSTQVLSKVEFKHKFWSVNASQIHNERQKRILDMLIDGFEGKLTSSKWSKIAKCSADTALRDIQDLIAKGILKQSKSGGRSTSYELIE